MIIKEFPLLYKTLDFTVDVNALTVTKDDGEVIKLRPKTCQFLIVLLSNAQSPVSKDLLLKKVWGDTVVAEQVVFQSINEIRKLFPEQEVIKTIPKQGYVWTPKVNVASDAQAPRKKTNYLKAAIFSGLLLLILAFTFYYSKSEPESVSGSIVILPVQNEIPGNDHSWIRMGLMDQLIESLPNDEHNAILQTDYVLEVLDRAGIDFKDIQLQDLPQVFKVSGAELIVSTTLSGSPHDYELSYVFHYRNAHYKGVLISRNIQFLVDELTKIIANRIGNGIYLSYKNYQSDFNEQMLGQAIDLRLAQKYQEAAHILKSIVTSNPNNLTAQRLLVETYFALHQVDNVEKQLDIALPIAEAKQDKDELVRLMNFKAIHLFYTERKHLVAEVTQKALDIAMQNNDWLYMAYIKGVQAELAISEERFNDAETLFMEAKEHHKILRCPIGESTTWGRLAILAKKQGEKDKFDDAIANARQIAKSRELTKNLEWLNTINFE